MEPSPRPSSIFITVQSRALFRKAYTCHHPTSALPPPHFHQRAIVPPLVRVSARFLALLGAFTLVTTF